MPPEKFFSQKEVSAPLERTAELNQNDDSSEQHVSELTLSESAQIATDPGIKERYVRTGALNEYSHSVVKRSFLPGTSKLERMVPGELTDEVWELVVREIRGMFGGRGSTNRIGKTREWTHRLELASVSTTEVPEGVHLQVMYRYGMPSGVVFLLLTIYSIMGAGAFIENVTWAPLFELAFAGAAVAGILAAVRAVLHFAVRRHRRKLVRLFEAIQDIIVGRQEQQEPVFTITEPESRVEAGSFSGVENARETTDRNVNQSQTP